MTEGELLVCSNIPLINIEIILALLFLLWLLVRLMKTVKETGEDIKNQELGNSENS